MSRQGARSFPSATALLLVTLLALVSSSCHSTSTASADPIDPRSSALVVQDSPAPGQAARQRRPRRDEHSSERDRKLVDDANSEGGFAGVWHTSYGAMRLTQDGAHVRGTYTYSSGSRIEGAMDGRLLRATYSEPDGTQGRAVFELAADGASFTGVWRPGTDRELNLGDAHAPRWHGTRVVPVPGRVWLVILEAHWESSLDEHEYSYGAMLRSFFERLPDVEVRHRFFHDRADFVRFCGELSALAEPVVLYISSHGSPDGIGASGDLIDGKTIGEALRDVGDLKLLHLGGCALLAGDLGHKVRAAAAPHPSFPITGFKVSVDWAGSAIVDFTYLDMVLERGMTPAEAVPVVRSMLSFAGPPGRNGDPLPGTDLTVLGPEE